MGFAKRFVAGETLSDAVAAATELSRAGRTSILNLLGENVATAAQANATCASYMETLVALESAKLPAHISIKPTQLGLDFDPSLALALTEKVAAAGEAVGRTVEIDMEGFAYRRRTLEILESAWRRHDNLGVAIQAYLRTSGDDLTHLEQICDPDRPLRIRLVKGAYLEPDTVAFQQKSEVDENYRELLDRLLRPGPRCFFTAIATHDPALVEYASERLRRLGYTREQYEFQMIYGIRRDLQQKLVAAGHPLRVYVPFGTAWCPYFMRRIAERPANLWFVLRSLISERGAPR